ncbi:MAG TPA: ArsA family ATPase, partial [Candidatus Ruania gallistercoris]|nr:ArsA family ATPase [Candidatus Ruania gallistercoris]
GVGKTVIASTLALARAEEGARVLVVSTDPAHNLGHLWDQEVGDAITPLGRAGLFGLEVDPERTTAEHLAEVGDRLERLVPSRLHTEVAKHLRLAKNAPGAFEAAILERIAITVTEQLDHFDLIVFDTAPSGHTARLVSLPETMSAWTQGMLDRHSRAQRFTEAIRSLDEEDPALRTITGDEGSRSARDAEIRRVLLARQERFTRLRDLLRDSQQTAFVAVLLGERLPALETVELAGQLAESGLTVSALVVNRRSPTDAGELLARRRAQEAEHIRYVTDRLPDLPVTEVPLLGEDLTAPDGLRQVAAALG